jgi:hypothetical protein
VFAQAGVPYGPRLVLDSKAYKEVAKKRKSDAGVGPVGKRAKASGWKAVPLKVPMASKGIGAASSKAAMVKGTPTKSLPRASAALGASIPPKAGTP